MIVRILAGVVLLGLSLTVWRVLVGPSRLVVNSDQVHFPTVSGFNLEREEFEFPRDLAGEVNLILIAFLQQHQATVDTWLPLAQELEAAFPGLAYYELPTIDEMPMLSRTFINEGMRAGIPDAKARQRTVTLYLDTAEFMRATGIPSKNEVHILLVNRAGDVLWRATGRLDEDKRAGLLQALDALAASGGGG